MEHFQLNKLLGNLDLHLLDQILKGRFDPGMRILDAGCGEGRNLQYFISQGYSVFGLDKASMAIKMLRMRARGVPKDNFVVANIEDRPFPPGFFNAILCINVLHHATDAGHFLKMLEALLDMLAIDGTFFIRMETGIVGRFIGQETHTGFANVVKNNVIMPWLVRHGLKSLEPIKREIVESQGDFITLVLQKAR